MHNADDGFGSRREVLRYWNIYFKSNNNKILFSFLKGE